MSDDLSYTSSSQNDFPENDSEENNDSSSMSSGLSELSATSLATNTRYAIIWELLQGCQDAALEDVPERHRGCLSIFDAMDNVRDKSSILEHDKGARNYDEIFLAAGAINSSDPWSLPAITKPISKEDALRPQNIQVLSVAQVTPTAAVFIKPDAVLAQIFQRISDAAAAADATEETKNVLQNASPLVDVKRPAFASTVFTSASQIAHRMEKPSFHALRRYNRLATTSSLLQMQAFHVDSPIFGVLLQGSLVAFHIDWYEERYGTGGCYSSWYTRNDEVTDIQIWDLQNPSEAVEVEIILSNLRSYTAGPYAAQVYQGLQMVNKPLKAWKWHPSLLPRSLPYSRLQQHDEESAEEKIDRWQESISMTSDDTSPGTWLRRDLHSSGKKKVGYSSRRRRSRDFLSPPSTPQLPEDQTN